MEELKLIEPTRTPAEVFVPIFDGINIGRYFQLAAALRDAGIGAEVYPEPKKLGKQLQYADKRGFRVALIAGDQEFDVGECQLKDLASGESVTASLTNSASAVITEIQ